MCHVLFKDNMLRIDPAVLMERLTHTHPLTKVILKDEDKCQALRKPHGNERPGFESGLITVPSKSALKENLYMT